MVNDNYSDFSENIEYRNSNINKISYNFKSIVNNLCHFMKIKQSEYNILLIEKDEEIQKLKRDLNNINSETYSMGLKSSRNKKFISYKNQYFDSSKLNKKNLNILTDFENTNQSFGSYKIYKTNEFDF